MKTALVIFTCNAAGGNIWQEVLASTAMQTMENVDKFILDSSSQDDTVKLAQAANMRCITLKREKFNHGTTRSRAVKILAAKGYEWVIFMSQDVVLKDADSLKNLLDYARNNQLAGCYGRQLGRNNNNFDAWQRSICYNQTSSIQSLDIDSAKKSVSCFFSDAFSVWHIPEVIEAGNFPESDFGEDALMAAALLKRGGRIGYCAEALAYHQHSSNLWSLFRRGIQAGFFRYRNNGLLKDFKLSETSILKNVPPRHYLGFAAKVSGYLLGRYPEKTILSTAILLMGILLLPAIIFADIPLRDVAGRYAPMAEAFAAGDWEFAFHPRITPLLPVAGGMVVMLTGCNGYMGCKIAASLLLVLSIFPLWSLCRKVYGIKAAAISVLLLASSAYLLRLGYYAVRETGSLLGIVLLFNAAACIKSSPKSRAGILLFAAGEAVLLWSRGDTALFAAIMFLVFFVWDLIKNRLPWRSVVAGSLLLGMLMPLLCINYYSIGYPVPEVRHALVWQKLEHKLPFMKRLTNPSPRMKIDISMSGGVFSDDN